MRLQPSINFLVTEVKRLRELLGSFLAAIPILLSSTVNIEWAEDTLRASRSSKFPGLVPQFTIRRCLPVLNSKAVRL